MTKTPLELYIEYEELMTQFRKLAKEADQAGVSINNIMFKTNSAFNNEMPYDELDY